MVPVVAGDVPVKYQAQPKLVASSPKKLSSFPVSENCISEYKKQSSNPCTKPLSLCLQKPKANLLKACAAQHKLSASFSKRFLLFEKKKEKVEQSLRSGKKEDTALLANECFALRAEASAWLKANIGSEHPLQHLPLEALKHPEKFVCFVQQMALFRTEAPEQALATTQCHVADVIAIADQYPTKYLLSLINLGVAFIDAYPEKTIRRQFQHWFSNWSDVLDLIRCKEFRSSNPSKLIERFSHFQNVTAAIRKYVPDFFPSGFDLKYYGGLRLHEIEAFFQLIEPYFGEARIRMPLSVRHASRVLSGESASQSELYPLFNGWELLPLLIRRAALPNTQQEVVRILETLFQWSGSNELDLSWLGALGLQSTSLDLRVNPQNALSLDVFIEWSPYIFYPNQTTAGNVEEICDWLQILQHPSGLSLVQRKCLKSVLENIQSVLKRRLHYQELLYLTFELRKHFQIDSDVDLLAVRRLQNHWLIQIHLLREQNPLLLSHYHLQDYSLVLQSIDLAQSLVHTTSKEDAELLSFFKQHQSGRYKRSDSNAGYTELDISEGIKSPLLTPGARLCLEYVYQTLKNGELKEILQAGVDEMAKTVNPLDEAGGALYFENRPGENKEYRIGSTSFIQISESDVDGEFMTSRSLLFHHLIFHFHPASHLDGSRGLTTGPSYLETTDRGILGDLGTAMRMRKKNLVITNLGNKMVNIDYFDGSGLVVDLGVFVL